MRDFNEINAMLKLVDVAIVIERSINVKVGREACQGPDINEGRGRNRMKSVRWAAIYWVDEAGSMEPGEQRPTTHMMWSQ